MNQLKQFHIFRTFVSCNCHNHISWWPKYYIYIPYHCVSCIVYKCKNKLDKYNIFKEQALHPKLILSTSKKYTCAYLLFYNCVSFPLDYLLDRNYVPSI